VKWKGEGREPLYPRCRSQLLEDGLGECVKSELLGRVGPRMKYAVVHLRVHYGEEEVVAVTLLGPRTHIKGLRLSIYDGPRAEKRFLFGLRVLVFPAESQVRVLPSRINGGVSHGSGRALSLGSSFA
jgi:hypothetical protein